MFASSVVWKGISYAILMFLAKATVGLVLYFDYFATRSNASKFATPSEPGGIAQHDGTVNETPDHQTKFPSKPPHLDAIIVGSTMIARGGFGFLVASEAQSSGTLILQSTGKILTAQIAPAEEEFQDSNIAEDQIFLVIIWALVLCTIAGPIASGLAVRRKLAAKKCECGMEPRILGEDVACHICLSG